MCERPEDQFSDEDMAEVGRSLMETLRINCPKWAPADNPAEIVVDLLNKVHDATALERERCAKICYEGAEKHDGETALVLMTAGDLIRNPVE